MQEKKNIQSFLISCSWIIPWPPYLSEQRLLGGWRGQRPKTSACSCSWPGAGIAAAMTRMRVQRARRLFTQFLSFTFLDLRHFRVYMHLQVRMGVESTSNVWVIFQACPLLPTVRPIGGEGRAGKSIGSYLLGMGELHPTVTQILVLGESGVESSVMEEMRGHAGHVRRAWLHSSGVPQSDGPVSSACGYSGVLISTEDLGISSSLINSIFTAKGSESIRVSVFSVSLKISPFSLCHSALFLLLIIMVFLFFF